MVLFPMKIYLSKLDKNAKNLEILQTFCSSMCDKIYESDS
jgi:hypothetical protein